MDAVFISPEERDIQLAFDNNDALVRDGACCAVAASVRDNVFGMTTRDEATTTTNDLPTSTENNTSSSVLIHIWIYFRCLYTVCYLHMKPVINNLT